MLPQERGRGNIEDVDGPELRRKVARAARPDPVRSRRLRGWATSMDVLTLLDVFGAPPAVRCSPPAECRPPSDQGVQRTL